MNVSRRNLIKSLGAGAAFAATGSLVGPVSTAQADGAKRITVALNWLPNVEYAGLWIADARGYFGKEGLELHTLPGGPNTPLAPVTVAAGQAEIGYATWLPFVDSVLRGNDFVAIGATFAVSPIGILSLPGKPIRTAKDLVGARILCPGVNERAAIEATLALNGLPKDYTAIPAGFSPEPLLQKVADGYAAYSTNQMITFETMGLVRDKDFLFLPLDTLGFKAAASMLFTTRKMIETQRSTLVAFLRATMHGWKDEESDPEIGAKLAVEKYGADIGLDSRQQSAQAKAQIALLHDPSSPGLPLLELSEANVAGPMYATARAAGRVDLPEPAKLFDFSLVREAAKGI